MFIIMWIVIIVLALIAVNTVLAVADVVAPYKEGGENAFRKVFVLIGMCSLPALAVWALIAAYHNF